VNLKQSQYLEDLNIRFVETNRDQNRSIEYINRSFIDRNMENDRSILELRKSNEILNTTNSEQEYSIFRLSKTSEDLKDNVHRNTAINEKQGRDIFAMKVQDKTLGRKITKNLETNIEQGREIEKNRNTNEKQQGEIHKNTLINQRQSEFFVTESIYVFGPIKTGALVLGTIKVIGEKIAGLDVSKMGVIFAENVKSISGFSNGATGQLLYVINTGEQDTLLEKEVEGDFQRLQFNQEEMLLEKNATIALIFDGIVWRILTR